MVEKSPRLEHDKRAFLKDSHFLFFSPYPSATFLHTLLPHLFLSSLVDMMLFSCHLWTTLWCLLVLLQDTNATLPRSGRVEVELVFPRNETYTTSTLMPFVFAISDPYLAVDLIPTLHFQISRFDSSPYIGGGIVEVPLLSLAQDPYFAYASPVNVTSVEADFQITWELVTHNCSGSPGNHSLTFADVEHYKTMWFRTRQGGQPVDLVEGTQTGACALSQSFDVSGTIDVPFHYNGSSPFYPSCHVIATNTSPTPTPTPCPIKIDSAAASSISASLSTSACGVPQYKTLLGCPTTSPTMKANAAQGRIQNGAGGSVWLAVAVAWLDYLLP